MYDRFGSSQTVTFRSPPTASIPQCSATWPKTDRGTPGDRVRGRGTNSRGCAKRVCSTEVVRETPQKHDYSRECSVMVHSVVVPERDEENLSETDQQCLTSRATLTVIEHLVKASATAINAAGLRPGVQDLAGLITPVSSMHRMGCCRPDSTPQQASRWLAREEKKKRLKQASVLGPSLDAY